MIQIFYSKQHNSREAGRPRAGPYGRPFARNFEDCYKRDYQKEKRLAEKQNVLQQKFRVDKPNRVWVSDVACFRINESIYMSVQFLIFFEEGRGLQSIP